MYTKTADHVHHLRLYDLLSQFLYFTLCYEYYSNKIIRPAKEGDIKEKTA
ncbi:hypothetical protein B14911_19935 [Bacillus sp. NRRL B-14911]|nr:hypothetical protein B14911_19935 [Bacillus sp. NRRL B-14911]